MSDFDAMRIEQAAWCEGWRATPLWLRLLGGPKRHYAEHGGRAYRMAWGELSLSRCAVGVSVGGYETAHIQIAIGLGQAFIRLPFLDRAICQGTNSIEQPRFGFSLHRDDAHLNWGRRCKIIYFPWQKRYLFNEYLDSAGEWRPRLRAIEPGAEAPKWSTVLPYRYMLQSGEVQERTATISRERNWTVWTWFGESTHPAALHNPRVRRRRARVSDFLRAMQKRFCRPTDYIDVRFSDEVGERAGSWKGGCVGCSYEMRPGETPAHTLARMQRERRFR